MRIDPPAPAVLLVDFNSLSRSGEVVATKRLARMLWGDVGAGSSAVLEDADGNTCRGVITSFDGRLFKVRPLWSTWVERQDLAWTDLGASTVVTSETTGIGSLPSPA